MNNDWTTNEESRLLEKQNYTTSLHNMTFSETKRYFSDVMKNIKHDLEFLKKQKTIWPAQCNSTIAHLDSAKAVAQKLCDAFNHRPYPVGVTAHSSARELVIQLYYAREQLDGLQELIRAFRPLCRASSKQAEKKRTVIFHKLELFLLHCDDIIQNLTSLQEKSRAAMSFHATSPLEAVDWQGHQIPGDLVRTFDPTLREKLRSHLVLVTDGYVEERDAPKQRLVEEDQPVQAKTEQQEQESMLIGDTQALVNSTGDRSCAVTGSCKPSSKLEGEQQDRDDLSDERPFCG